MLFERIFSGAGELSRREDEESEGSCPFICAFSSGAKTVVLKEGCHVINCEQEKKCGLVP
jgi:hypothetical protein